ncbi:MAG: hypothetical protein ACPHF4_06385, partial [Rubripirellula sp.]
SECRDIHVIPFQGSQNKRVTGWARETIHSDSPVVWIKSAWRIGLAKLLLIHADVTDATVKQAARASQPSTIARTENLDSQNRMPRQRHPTNKLVPVPTEPNRSCND